MINYIDGRKICGAQNNISIVQQTTILSSCVEEEHTRKNLIWMKNGGIVFNNILKLRTFNFTLFNQKIQF